MPYGMSLFLWTTDATGDEFAPLFEKLRTLGFDSVEVPIFAPDPAAYARLGRRLDGLGLARTAATALSEETNLISPDPRQRRAGMDYLRAVPGRGQVRWDETFAALRKIGYTGALTIEAFGERLPALAAATKVWRRMFESEEQLAREGLAFLKSRWEGR